MAELSLEIGVLIGLQSELLNQSLFGSQKAHRQEHQVGFALLLAAGNFIQRHAAAIIPGPIDTHGSNASHPSVAVVDEFLGENGEFAGILSELLGGFGVAVLDPVNLRPLGPRVLGGPLRRGLGQQFKVDQAAAVMAQSGADAVGARVAPSDHDHLPVASRDKAAILELGVEITLGALEQELHGEVDTLEFSSRNRQIPRLGCSASQKQGVVLLDQFLSVGIDSDMGIGHEMDPFLSQELHAAVDHLLFQLHGWNPVHEKTTDTVVAFVDGHLVTHLVELGCGRQAGGSGTDDCDFFPRAFGGRLGLDPALVESTIDNGVFNVLDGDRGIGNAQYTGTLTGGWTGSTGKFRKVVGLVQTVQSLSPVSLVNQIVPFRYEVVDGAAGVGLAKGHAAVHAAGSLGLEVLLGCC